MKGKPRCRVKYIVVEKKKLRGTFRTRSTYTLAARQSMMTRCQRICAVVGNETGLLLLATLEHRRTPTDRARRGYTFKKKSVYIIIIKTSSVVE